VNEPHITVVGNLGAEPRTRVLANGAVVTDFRIAATPRKVDPATGVWSDRETMWFTVSCWKAMAEHCAVSLHKGDRVVVTGRLTASTWTTEEGEKRSALEVNATTVGFDLSRGKVVQERSVPLTVTSDPGFPTATVDIATGELRPGSGFGEPDVDADDDDHDGLDDDERVPVAV
jgi:single-strand DNA-binding protein